MLEQIPYFNKQTLGQILKKQGSSLDYWVKTLVKRGDLIVLKKGFYVSRFYLLSLSKNPEARERYLEYLANMIRFPSYISLEYALSKYGAIPEGVAVITSLTTKSTRSFQNSLGSFTYRNIKPELFFGFKNFDFEGKRVKFASKAKALFDFFYFKKQKELAGKGIGSFRINWDVFEDEDRKEFREFVKISDSIKLNRVLKSLQW